MSKSASNTYTLIERSLHELSDIKTRYFTVAMPFADYIDILIVSFEGSYGQGARGNKDAVFMTAMIRAGLAAWSAFGLILDFSRLGYDYGDMMDGVLNAADGTWIGRVYPTVVITSDLNRNGLTSLVLDVMGDSPSQWLFNSMDEAIAEIGNRHGV